ncbi:cation-translocating P-type ATPase [uncultured Arcanobacterium sp.]|uniref:heavy metal translocating P-type ATPase n=1 Tax=uncultured Arcanobacterium sp. TaxID=487520 RepID=UPI0026130314|nr:cation-translocating P-type ATPase [uncultured Arcanobacterium sp.]
MDFSTDSAGYGREMDLAISGMTCASCVARVEKKLNKLPGVQAVVNLATERAHLEITAAGKSLDAQDIIHTVEKAGYGARLLTQTYIDEAGEKHLVRQVSGEEAAAAAKKANAEKVAGLLRRFQISLGLSIPVVAISMLPFLQFPAWQWVVALLSLPVVFWCALPFHRAAFRAARYGSSTMDTLVSLGVLVSFGWSFWALYGGEAGHSGYQMHMRGIHSLAAAGTSHIYFESAAMIVTFLLFGRWLEAKSRRSAGDALQELLDLGVQHVFIVRRADGQAVNKIVPITQLKCGDLFRTRPGEKIATDGVVVEGNSAVDTSLLTGESLPLEVAPGAEVTGASLNTYGSLLVRAERVGADTVLAQMGKLLAEAQTGKSSVQRLADKISAVFVPAVLILSLCTLLLRLFALQDPVGTALSSAIAVLVVACPCALGLATPTALLVGSGNAARAGILIKGADILENAHRIDTIIFDKTGTLTTGKMTVAGVIPLGKKPEESYLLALAAGLEIHSEHPIAGAIKDFAQSKAIRPLPITDFQAIPGKGISGQISEGSTASAINPMNSADAANSASTAEISSFARAGTLAWLETQGVDIADARTLATDLQERGSVAVAIAYGREILGIIEVRDTLRKSAFTAVSALKKQGMQVLLASGDSPAAVQTIGAELGIRAHGGMLPATKLQLLQDLQAKGEKVAMIGDGINDAAALAAADLSIAMGSGTDVAKAAADITIVNSKVSAVPQAIAISRRTLRIIKENLFWAFGYNLLAIPLAAGGIIMPGLAAAAMASSSVIVVLNSLRLRSPIRP